MNKVRLLIFLLCGCCSAMAQSVQQSSTSGSMSEKNVVIAEDTLKKGRREVNGGFRLASGQNTSYNIAASYAHFWRDQLSFSLDLGVNSFGSETSLGTGLGVEYYFALSGAMAPFVAQQISTTSQAPSEFGGSSRIGVLYLATPNVGFKVFGQLAYPLDRPQDLTSDLLGEFAIFF